MGELSRYQKNVENTMIKKALIFGIAGQTGSYLAEHLLQQGNEVHGVIRRQSTPEHQESRIAHLADKIKTYYGDVTDYESVANVIRSVQPDLIFSLAAQSHVRISFDIPIQTFNTNANGVLNILSAYKEIRPQARLIQASSSEMFGNSVDLDGMQREKTPMHPVSPYGISKLAAYSMVRHYRNAYGLHASNSICFNHESPRRASNFVTSKIIKSAVLISKGKQDKLYLGNIQSHRDWGHAKDYARAIWTIILNNDPGDYVVSTQETHSVEELCVKVFSKLGMDFWDYVEFDKNMIRPEELKYLKGDSSRIRKLGWNPEYTFDSMIDEMIEHWQKVYE